LQGHSRGGGGPIVNEKGEIERPFNDIATTVAITSKEFGQVIIVAGSTHAPQGSNGGTTFPAILSLDQNGDLLASEVTTFRDRKSSEYNRVLTREEVIELTKWAQQVTNGIIEDLKITKEGKVYLLARSLTPERKTGIETFFVIRYKTDLTVDDDFADEGIYISNYKEGDTDYSTSAYALQLQPHDENFLVLGNSEGKFLLTRVTPKGSIDPSFGTEGWVNIKTDEEVTGQGKAMAIHEDGSIVAAVNQWIGNPDRPESSEFSLLQFWW